jgi:anti-sigma B factor antagonist
LFAGLGFARMRVMPSETFQVKERAGAGEKVRILEVIGPITSSTSQAFQDAVKRVSAPCLILDLTGVPSVDSMAVGALVRAFVTCNKSGRQLALVGLSHRVQNVLQLTGIAPLFDTYLSASQAEQALQ